MSNEILQKVITTTSLGGGVEGGGLLKPEKADRFIDYVWSAAVLGSQVRTVRMKSDTVELDKIGVGKRLLRVATEAVDDGVNAGIGFSRISLTTVKMRLDWELTSESLEDGLEGDALEDHVARIMATQVGTDLEDLAINGDTTRTGDPLLKALDGWSRRAETTGHVINHGGAAVDPGVFNRAIKRMPREYRQRRGEIRFFAGGNIIQDYLFSQGQVSPLWVRPESSAASTFVNGGAPDGPAGFNAGIVLGVPLIEVPLMSETQAGTYSGATGDHGDVWLTFPRNLVWGVKRDVVVFREFKPKKDTIEYTLYVRVGAQVENADAFVVVRDVKISV